MHASYPYGFVGADAQPGAVPPPRRTGLTADLAPIVAPATGGVIVEKHLDDKQVLHVRICVDGKCYSTSMDLAPAIAMVMQKLARWHDSANTPKLPPSTVIRTVDTAVGVAEEALVGALVAQHIDTIAAGILGDIAGAVKGAITGIASGVASTFRKLKGPIGVAAGIAATSAAAAIPGVGPVVAPMAGKIANDLVQAAAGDDKAKQAVAQAQQKARTDPNTALALETAAKAVANSTAAHHVKETATKAARGDAASQQQIAQVAVDAEKGDPAAKAVADMVASVMKSEWGAKLWEKATGRGPDVISGWPWYDVAGMYVGADVPPTPADGYKALIAEENQFWGHAQANLNAAQDQVVKNPDVKAITAAIDAEYARSATLYDREWQTSQERLHDLREKRSALLHRLRQASPILVWTASTWEPFRRDWLDFRDRVERHGALSRPDAPAIVRQFQERLRAVQASAPFAPYAGRGTISAVGQGYAGPQTIAGQWQYIVGAALDDIRETARTHASTKRGNAAGVIQYADGSLHGRGFGSLERARKWLDHATRNRTIFIYAVACSKDRDGTARIYDEKIGDASRIPSMPSPVPAAVSG